MLSWERGVTSLCDDRLVGLVVKVSASRAEDPGSNPACGFFLFCFVFVLFCLFVLFVLFFFRFESYK